MQTAGGTFKDDTQRTSLLDAVDLLECQNASQRRSDDRERRRSDQEIARPQLHPKNPTAMRLCDNR